MKRHHNLVDWPHSFWVWLSIVLVLALGLFYLVEDVFYANRVFPGVYLGGLNLSGKTREQVQSEVNQLVKDLSRQEITFRLNDWQATYTAKKLGVVWLAPKITQEIWGFGRQPQAPLMNLWQRLQGVMGAHLPAVYQEQMDGWDRAVGELRQQIDQVGVDGEVIIGDHRATIKPAVTGRILDGTALHQMMVKRYQMLDWQPINLPVQLAPPAFTDELTQITADKINQYMSQGYQLTARDRHWEISSEQLWQWVEVIKHDNALVVRLRPIDLNNYLQNLKSTEVDQTMQNAILVMSGKSVSKFQPDQPGVNLHAAAAADLLQSTLLTPERAINLPADYVEPHVNLADLNDLGINELVSRGESNFAGSPPNRRHNIKVGKNKFDLVLVAPNEVFSFNKTLGVVDDTTGYLPELVIKGDETTPEFGGGLCQVSTTAFRAALLGGYEIKERHNHTYRVSYYEPAGTDATIYPPYPDMKFLNDTPYYILIHTIIDGNNLYFDFYSTKTGRRVELEGPQIYDITEPPPPVYIETSDLPEGETKKIDTAHRGASVVVYRHIYDSQGREIRKDTFKSFYIPWPAKYLVGAKVAPKVETNLGNVPPDATASETPPVNISPTS